VFSHFAELGDSARLYLLKNRTVGRFLGLFYEGEKVKNTDTASQKFKDKSLAKVPLFIMEKELYMGKNSKKVDVHISDIERKNVIQSATPYSIFLIYTASVLVKSCVFVKTANKSPFANDSLCFVLDQNELTMLCDHS